MIDPLQKPVEAVGTLAQSMEREEREKFHRELREMHDKCILAVFNSAEGDQLLNLWDDYYLRQPVVVAGSPEGTDAMREGRNAFIRLIRLTVNRARGVR